MLRRSLLINCAVSLISTAVMMSSMPTLHGVVTSARTTFLAYAQDDALLSPLVHRVLSLR